MFPLDAPPDTSAYMIAGYGVFFIIAAIYLVSLFVRWRNIDRDMTALESIEKESKSIPPKKASPARRKGAGRKNAARKR
ncbi:MAG TPA: hypothetical protein VLZ89_12775 [Anaerolineales bacterium]|nr:hypothetical protein [Anaerolineales bacterium]